MILFHGSNMKVDAPTLKKSREGKDFGRGFYLTEKIFKAWLMAKRRSDREGGIMTVSKFNFSFQKATQANLRIKEFKDFSTDWAKFILQNRASDAVKHSYDIVVGPVADAIVDSEINRYKAEFGEHYLEDENLEIFVERVNQYKLGYIQYAFCSKKAIEQLIFVKHYER